MLYSALRPSVHAKNKLHCNNINKCIVCAQVIDNYKKIHRTVVLNNLTIQ